MATSNCENCALRARYDKNPRSLLGRIWRFHIRFCPGWKSYMSSLPEEKKSEIRERYGL